MSSADECRNGDLNVLGPFIPFASPMETAWTQQEITALSTDESSGRCTTTTTTLTKAKLKSHAFKCVLNVFQRENVGLVVRLNDEL